MENNRNRIPCPSCKFYRRRCQPDCPMEFLLPANPPGPDEDNYGNPYELFGYTNIREIMNKVPPEQKPIAGETLILEANARANDPVGGCTRVIIDMEDEILRKQIELYHLKELILRFRPIVAKRPGQDAPRILQERERERIGRRNVDHLGLIDLVREPRIIGRGNLHRGMGLNNLVGEIPRILHRRQLDFGAVAQPDEEQNLNNDDPIGNGDNELPGEHDRIDNFLLHQLM